MKRKHVLPAAVILGMILTAVLLIRYTGLIGQPDTVQDQQQLADQTNNPTHRSEKQQNPAVSQPAIDPQEGNAENSDFGQQSENRDSVSGQQQENQNSVSGQQASSEVHPPTEEQQIADNQETSLETIGVNDLESFFYEELTDEIKERINGKSYGENCTVPYEDLRYVKVLHWGFDGKTHEGELIVNKSIAQDVVDIFKELYDLKYPIERMVLVDEYDADDNTSMAADNSSAFNYRVIEGTSRISLHSYGLAVDINPLYNPYVHKIDGETVVTPENGAKYEDRTLECEYYIQAGDACYDAFIKHGFTWGGDWQNNKDYQHFQKESR